MTLGEVFQFGERDAGIEIRRAGLQDVQTALRILGHQQRFEIRVEEGRGECIDFGDEVLMPGLFQRALQVRGGKFGEEFLRGGFVVVAFVGPEKHGEIEDRAVDGRVDLRFVGDNGFEHTFLTQAEAGELVVDDRLDGDGGLLQPVVESLLLRGEAGEALRFNLDECGGVDAVGERSFVAGSQENGGGRDEAEERDQAEFQHETILSSLRALGVSAVSESAFNRRNAEGAERSSLRVCRSAFSST